MTKIHAKIPSMQRCHFASKKTILEVFIHQIMGKTISMSHPISKTGHVVLPITSRVASSIPAWSHTFMEIDHDIISTTVLLLLLIQEGLLSVCVQSTG